RTPRAGAVDAGDRPPVGHHDPGHLGHARPPGGDRREAPLPGPLLPVRQPDLGRRFGTAEWPRPLPALPGRDAGCELRPTAQGARVIEEVAPAGADARGGTSGGRCRAPGARQHPAGLADPAPPPCRLRAAAVADPAGATAAPQTAAAAGGKVTP